MGLLDTVNSVLNSEDQRIRPYSQSGLPGGYLILKHDIPTVIVPDIHARMDLVISVLLHEIYDNSIIDLLDLKAVQVVCVGDGVHAEKRAARRWMDAFEESKGDFSSHESMDKEMRESLGTMEMIMEIKCAFPSHFHFLKGNHENISNEEGGGNHPFLKFSDEGAMVEKYIRKFYGEEFMNRYYLFEKNLPVFAAGRNFLISHAEPEMFYSMEDIIEYRDNPHLIEGLTWTGNDDALPGSVNQMIESFIEEELQGRSYYFGGHRPIKGKYNARAEGRYIQIHNPDKFIIALIQPDRDIDLDTDIIEIEDRSVEIGGL